MKFFDYFIKAQIHNCYSRVLSEQGMSQINFI